MDKPEEIYPGIHINKATPEASLAISINLEKATFNEIGRIVVKLLEHPHEKKYLN